MERFTYKHDGEWCINGVNGKVSSDNQANYWGEAINRFAEYEDLEEDGRLIRLPCKIGDKVWINYHDFIYESSISGFFIEKNQIIVEFGCCRPITATYATNFGKTIFLSYEEAERSLVKS